MEWFKNIRNPHTRRAYRNAIGDFMQFTGIQRPEEFRIVTPAHVIAWRDALRDRILNGTTIRHRLSAHSALFQYLCDKNAVTHNPVKGIKRPKVESDEGKTPAIADHQARKLLVSPPEKSLKGIRDRGILATLLYHGLRREELCKLSVGDYRHERRGVQYVGNSRIRQRRAITISSRGIGSIFTTMYRMSDHCFGRIWSAILRDTDELLPDPAKCAEAGVDLAFPGRLPIYAPNTSPLGRLLHHRWLRMLVAPSVHLRPRVGRFRLFGFLRYALLMSVAIVTSTWTATGQTPTSPVYTIRTIAGNGVNGFSGDGGAATNASLSEVGGVAVDAAGNVYIADILNHRIRKISNGAITTVAGNGIAGFSGDNGPAVAAQLNNPEGVAVDSAGNIYIADTYNGRIRKVSSGVITTIAGGGDYRTPPDYEGAATAVGLSRPAAIAVDRASNVYVVEVGGNRVRKISNGMITLLAGNGAQEFDGDYIPAVDSHFNQPNGVAVDSAGNVFIADTWNSRVRVVWPTGTVVTVAGTGSSQYNGPDGPAAKSAVPWPIGVATDSSGGLYISNSGNLIRKVMAGGITTIAGTGSEGSGGDGGPALKAQFHEPNGIAVDSAGAVYIADRYNYKIRVLTPTPICTYSVSPTALQAPASGATLSLGVQTGASCTWALSGAPNWITFPSTSSGTGSNTISLVVAQNTTAAARTATLQVAGVSVQVSQAGGTPMPSISAGGIVNSANYSASVAPGSIVAIFGQFLVGSTTIAAGTPWPTRLSGVSLQFGGKYDAPVYAVSPGQATAQVPWEVAITPQSVTVTSGPQTSSPQMAMLVPFAPAIFSMNQQGTGQGAVTDAITGRVIDASSPAMPGSTYVTIYCTGLGAVTNRPATGSAATASPLSYTLTTPDVTIGGVRAPLLFSGLAPGFVGLYQINVQVPADSPTGNAVPVSVSIGGATSNIVTMAIRGSGITGGLQIQITGLPAGVNPSVTISSPGYSNTITSSQTLQVEPDSYTVIANTVASSAASYAAFPAQQTAPVTAGATSTIQVAYNAVIPPAVQTISSQAPGLSVSADGSTISVAAGTNAAKSLSPGNILALGVTPSTPNGLLRQVVSVTQNGSQVTAQTTQATLTDVFQDADFTFQTVINPQNARSFQALVPGARVRASASACAPIDFPTTPLFHDENGTIDLDGSIELCPKLDFNWHVSGFSLKSLTATATLTENVHLSLSANYKAGFDKRIEIAKIAAAPIVASVGFVPIVLTPSVTFYVGAAGNAQAGFSAGATQTGEVTGGLTYANGQFSPVFQHRESFTSDPFAVSAGVTAKLYAGASIELLLDGVLAPNFAPDAYIQFDADIAKNPWWTLSGGLEGGAGVSLRIFGHTLKDFTKTDVFNFSKVIAQASGGFVPADVAPVLKSITPNTAPAGSPDTNIMVTGSNFRPGAVAFFSGTAIPTVYISPQQLTATIPTNRLSATGTYMITIGNADTLGVLSGSLSFTVQPAPNPQPTILSLSPNSVTAGATPQNLTIKGSGFLAVSTVTFNGVNHSATFVDNSQLTIPLSAADLSKAGSYPVVVTNPPPGGGSSQPAVFTVQAAPVTLRSFTLDAASVGGGGTVGATLVLTTPALAGGAQIILSSDNPSVQTPPAVTIPAGQTSISFVVTTIAVATNQTATIRASLAGSVLSAKLTVTAVATSTNIFLGTILHFEGTAALDGSTVRFRGTAGLGLLGSATFDNLLDTAASATVSITFDDKSAYITGNSVTFTSVVSAASGYSSGPGRLPEQVSKGTFTVTATSNTVGGPVAGTLDFTAGGTAHRATFTGTISQCEGCNVPTGTPPLQGVSFDSATVEGGFYVTGGVSLVAPAPSGGTVVYLSANNTALPIASSITVPAGQTSAAFFLQTKTVTSQQTVTLSAGLGTVLKTATLSILPTALLNPWAQTTTLIEGTATVDNTSQPFKITVFSPGLDATAIFQTPADLTTLSSIGVVVAYNRPQFAGQTVSFSGTDSANSVFVNAKTGAQQTVTAGSLSLTSTSPTIGATVQGLLSFTAGGVTRQVPISGRITSAE